MSVRDFSPERWRGRRAIVLAGGEPEPPDFVRGQAGPDDLLVAVNGGSCLAMACGLRPHVVVGDLDSAVGVALPPQTLVLPHPTEKNESDLELGLDLALSVDPADVRIIGGLGGRLDHLLTNVGLLHRARARRVPTRLVGATTCAFLVDGDERLCLPLHTIVSLVPLTPTVEGVTLEGFRYGLLGETLQWGTSRGLSNVALESPARIRVTDGILLVVATTIPLGGCG